MAKSRNISGIEYIDSELIRECVSLYHLLSVVSLNHLLRALNVMFG